MPDLFAKCWIWFAAWQGIVFSFLSSKNQNTHLYHHSLWVSIKESLTVAPVLRIHLASIYSVSTLPDPGCPVVTYMDTHSQSPCLVEERCM